MAEERETSRDYVLFAFDGETYTRAGIVHARKPEEALEEYLDDHEDEEDVPFMIVPERFTGLREADVTRVKQLTVKSVNEADVAKRKIPGVSAEDAA